MPDLCSSLVRAFHARHSSLLFRRPGKRPPTRLPNLTRCAIKVPENFSAPGDAVGRDEVHLEAKDHRAHLRLSIGQGAAEKNARSANPPRPCSPALATNVGALLGSLGRDVGPLGSEAIALNLHTVFFAGRHGLPNLRKRTAFGGTGGRLRGTLIFGTEQQGPSDKNYTQQNNDERGFCAQADSLTFLDTQSQAEPKVGNGVSVWQRPIWTFSQFQIVAPSACSNYLCFQ